MSTPGITEHFVRLASGHGTFYLQAGPDTGPAIIMAHGWPELSLSWRHVLPTLGALGFRAIAVDLRGFGRSTTYDTHADYAQEKIVGDHVGLLDALGIEKAVFLGHDWGVGGVWGIAAHHPDRVHAVANLSVPYRTIERGMQSIQHLVDREIYPEDRFPWGQWMYYRFYQERFDRAESVFNAAPERVVKLMFRRGNPAGLRKPTGHATVFENNGWFGGGDIPPDVERDDAVLSAEELAAYSESLKRNGFFGPDSLYMNDEANLEYSNRSVNGGRLDMPVLFIAGRYDITCESVDSRLGEPMREFCSDLTEDVVYSGHWMAQERPVDLNGVLVRWLATKVPQAWPRPVVIE